MIQKLRRRFIGAAMLSLFLVLLVILGTVNIVSYTKTVADADNILSLLSENQGAFPMHLFPDKEMPRDDQRQQPRDSRLQDRRHFSPETPYESRFFSVTLDAENGSSLTDTANIAAVDREMAEDYAGQAVASGKSTGFLDNYRYLVTEQQDSVRVIFLDCERSLSGFRTTLLASLCVAAAGLMGVFVLLLFFSGRIVKPIAESDARQRQFITDAGHEIKTPLTIINADADLLALECGESEWLEDIRRQTQRMVGLTNDLIYLSRMDEEREAVTFVEFPLSDVVEETAQSFLAPVRQQGKGLTLEIAPLLSLEGSEKDIRQLVSILLDNALKYSPENSEIRLRLEKEGKFIRLTVRNTTAAPIEKEKLSHIFDRFYRMDSSRNSAAGGYGLGLAIAAGIVSAHKGKIRAESPGENILEIQASFPA